MWKKNTIYYLLIFYIIILYLLILKFIIYENYQKDLKNTKNIFQFSNQFLSEEEKTAFHEAGHAVISLNYPTECHIQEISIIPNTKNKTAGYNYTNFNNNTKYTTKIAILLGGTAAETLLGRYNNKIAVNEIGNGSTNDHNKIHQIIAIEQRLSEKKELEIVNKIFNNNLIMLMENQELLKIITQNLLDKKILSQTQIENIYQKYQEDQQIRKNNYLNYNFQILTILVRNQDDYFLKYRYPFMI